MKIFWNGFFNGAQADDPCQAVELFAQWRPHFIWMDIRMPVLDGLEATRQIKAGSSNPPVIIALTASAFRDDRSITLEAGCDEYLSKPYREAEIFDALSRHLGVRFLYENQPDGEETVNGSGLDGEPVTALSLAVLPPGLLNRLGIAALEGDILSLEAVISEISEQHTALGHALDQLANQFEYDKIHSLVQETLQAGGRA